MSRSTLRFDSRVVAAAVAAAILVSPAVPGPLGEPARRLVNSEADGRDPKWDRPLDGDALRRAADRIPDDGTYALDAAGADPVLQGNLKAGAQLFFAPTLPVQDLRRADVVVAYRNGRLAVGGAR